MKNRWRLLKAHGASGPCELDVTRLAIIWWASADAAWAGRSVQNAKLQPDLKRARLG